MSDFKKKVDNSRMADPNVEEIRKSAPLFRDLSGTRCTAVRAKYLNDKCAFKAREGRVLCHPTQQKCYVRAIVDRVRC